MNLDQFVFLLIMGALVSGILFLLWRSGYTIEYPDAAVIEQLGEPVEYVRKAGLHFRTPVLQRVIMVPGKPIKFNIPAQPAVTRDSQSANPDIHITLELQKEVDDGSVTGKRGTRIVSERAIHDFAYTISTRERLQDFILPEISAATDAVIGQYDASELQSQQSEIERNVLELLNRRFAELGWAFVVVGLSFEDLRVPDFLDRTKRVRDAEAQKLITFTESDAFAEGHNNVVQKTGSRTIGRMWAAGQSVPKGSQFTFIGLGEFVNWAKAAFGVSPDDEDDDGGSEQAAAVKGQVQRAIRRSGLGPRPSNVRGRRRPKSDW